MSAVPQIKPLTPEEQKAKLKAIGQVTPHPASLPATENAAPRSVKMTGKYQRKHLRPAVSIGGATAINPCEIMMLVALPGSGKTQMSEVFGCAYIANAHGLEGIDTFGVEVNAIPGRKALFCDTERSLDDNSTSFDRIRRRIDVERYPHTYDEETGEFHSLDYRCFSTLISADEFKQELALLVESGEYGFIIIDGILDFVSSMNDDKESERLVKWIRGLANRFDLAIVCTLHPNKGTENVAGHLGGFLYRWCRSALIIKPHEHDRKVKRLTNAFDQSKMSHGGEVDVLFTWSDEARMMVSVDQAPVRPPKPDRKRQEKQVAFTDIFKKHVIAKGDGKISSGDLYNYVMAAYGVGKDAAKNHIGAAVALGIITPLGSGNRNLKYALSSQEGDAPAPVEDMPL